MKKMLLNHGNEAAMKTHSWIINLNCVCSLEEPLCRKLLSEHCKFLIMMETNLYPISYSASYTQRVAGEVDVSVSQCK